MRFEVDVCENQESWGTVGECAWQRLTNGRQHDMPHSQVVLILLYF